MNTWPFDSVLVANRGEIALRILRSVHALGLRSVAVFSDADIDAPHVRAADQAVRIGPAPVGSSYLDVQAILYAARLSGAGAVHPGYGFLSENAAFCKACTDVGLVFIGPGAEAIRVMGDKRLAKERMQSAGVPCIPGYLGSAQDVDAFIAAAKAVGYPVMIKAAAGGGGRGMRLIAQESALAAGLESAGSEARNAFGDGTLYLEKALHGARHVEVQVIADRQGNTLHLGERDCSVQRRHQKIVEEAPSPAVNADLRARMTADAVTAARAIGYENAGTVEFLLAADGSYYFLEMNTRLQVEHPVTEMVTGLDLVELQLRVAAGERLPLTQSQVRLNGHAIEVRLYAEDPARGFLPQTGQVACWRPAQGEGVRTDAGIAQGQAVTPYYDPMLAKIIAFGKDREEARRRLAAAVERTVILGVPTNKDYLARILRHAAFAAGSATTDFVAQLEAEPPQAEPKSLRAVAALLFCWPDGMTVKTWRDAGEGQWLVPLGGEPVRVNRDRAGNASIRLHERTVSLRPLFIDSAQVTVAIDSLVQKFQFHRNERGIEVAGPGATRRYSELLPDTLRSARSGGDGRLFAPISGRIVRINAALGAVLAASDCVLVVEAMKMEHEIVAGVAGTLASISAHLGAQVQARQLLATMTPVDAASGSG